MSLKYKLSLFVSLLFVVSGLASVAVNRLVIMPSFLELEHQQAERNTSRAAEGINRDLEVLSTNVTAWSQWDESKLFMEGENDAFVEGELNAEAVASAEISYMGFYRLDGELVIYRAPEAELSKTPGVDLLQGSLSRHHPLLRHVDVRDDVRGLVSTPSGPMLVASRPILNSSGEPPAVGVLVFGRLLDSIAIRRIADQNKLDLAIEPATPQERESGRSPAPEWRPGEPHDPSEILLTEAESILLGETTLADLEGRPLLRMRVTTPRSISARGEEATRFALATLCAVALAVLGTLLALIHVVVLNPIAKMTAHAVELGDTDTLDKRLAIDREDELGVLAKEFNRMTEHLAEARQRLVDQSFVSGKAGMAAGILHNIGNAITPITVRLNTLTDRFKSAPCADLERAVSELESGSSSQERRSDLARYVQLAAIELVALTRDADEQLRGAVVQVEHVQQILSAQERYSRAGSLTGPVEIELLLRRVAEGLSPDLLRVVAVEIDPSVREIGAVEGNRVEIQQIIGNLMLNAAESIKSHCISEGRIRVRANREPGKPPLAHFVFEDNGAGISSGDLAKLFHRGFTTKARGSGLGLHWSANSVAALGGKLRAESRGVGHGATLHLLLPLVEHPEPVVPHVPQTENA